MRKPVDFALFLNTTLLLTQSPTPEAAAQDAGGPESTENADTNGDGPRDIADAVYLLSWYWSTDFEGRVGQIQGED